MEKEIRKYSELGVSATVAASKTGKKGRPSTRL